MNKVSVEKTTLLFLLLLTLLIGITLGYGWRMLQVEPIRDKEVCLLKKELELLERDYREALGRIEAMKPKRKPQQRYIQ